jgi:hypothetical protein
VRMNVYQKPPCRHCKVQVKMRKSAERVAHTVWNRNNGMFRRSVVVTTARRNGGNKRESSNTSTIITRKRQRSRVEVMLALGCALVVGCSLGIGGLVALSTCRVLRLLLVPRVLLVVVRVLLLLVVRVVSAVLRAGLRGRILHAVVGVLLTMSVFLAVHVLLTVRLSCVVVVVCRLVVAVVNGAVWVCIGGGNSSNIVHVVRATVNVVAKGCVRVIVAPCGRLELDVVGTLLLVSRCHVLLVLALAGRATSTAHTTLEEIDEEPDAQEGSGTYGEERACDCALVGQETEGCIKLVRVPRRADDSTDPLAFPDDDPVAEAPDAVMVWPAPAAAVACAV